MSLEPLAQTPLELPPAPRPIGNYAPGVLCGGLLFLSGQTALPSHPSNDAPSLTAAADLTHPQDAARQAALHALAQAQTMLGALDRIVRVVRLTGYVRSEADFTRHAAVIDAASVALQHSLGTSDRHARSAIGVSSLPHGAIVELDIILEVRD